jgi:hypothetical protein
VHQGLHSNALWHFLNCLDSLKFLRGKRCTVKPTTKLNLKQRAAVTPMARVAGWYDRPREPFSKAADARFCEELWVDVFGGGGGVHKRDGDPCGMHQQASDRAVDQEVQTEPWDPSQARGEVSLAEPSVVGGGGSRGSGTRTTTTGQRKKPVRATRSSDSSPLHLSF